MASLSPVPANWVFDASRDPPVYTRPMVGSELAMQRHWDEFDADGQVCIGLTFTSSLDVKGLRDRAREALDKLRFVCPIIACTVEDVVSPRWVYTPSADREAWIDLALVVEQRGISLNIPEFIQAISFQRLPYVEGHGTTTFFRAYLLTTLGEGNDDNREYGLYFHGTHSVIDAGPALHALNLMCEWISGGGMEVTIKPLEEWKNLPVDPVTATGGPSSEWATGGTKLLQVFAEENARTSPCHTLPPPHLPLKMSDTPFMYFKSVSQSDTAAITAATKKLGVSISSLFYAAHCLAQFKMNPVSTTEVDFSTEATVVALERYLKPLVNPKTHFISSFTLLPLRFSMARPLMEDSEKERLIVTAKMVQERFNTYLVDPCLPQLMAVMANMTPATAEQDTKAVPEQVEVAEDWKCAFNNLGVIENKLRLQQGVLTVGHIGIGVRLRNFMTIHAWTMHSRLHFQIVGATAWGEECIKTLLEETVRIGLLVADSTLASSNESNRT